MSCKKPTLVVLTASAAMLAVGTAEAAQGCGPGGWRGASARAMRVTHVSVHQNR